jgi:hypothetical protein
MSSTGTRRRWIEEGKAASISGYAAQVMLLAKRPVNTPDIVGPWWTRCRSAFFLASPGDLLAERKVVRASVDEHNARRRGENNVTYEVVGWERVRGTARRP